MDRRQSHMIKKVTWLLQGGWFAQYFPTTREAEKLAVDALVETGFDTTNKAMAFIRNKRREQAHIL